MNILIADIDTYVVNQLQIEINRSCPDWQISVVTSGFLCLETVRNNNCPDVIILGMELTDISGLELIELIRDDSDIPVVLLSEDNGIRTLLKAFDKGASDYIVKPFSNNVFMARLKSLIRREVWNNSYKHFPQEVKIDKIPLTKY